MSTPNSVDWVDETVERLRQAAIDLGYERPTLRDQFAMAALGSLRSNSGSDEWRAAEAYRIADAMLAERAKEKP